MNQVRRGNQWTSKRKKKIIPSNRQNGKKVQMSSFNKKTLGKEKKINRDFEQLRNMGS